MAWGDRAARLPHVWAHAILAGAIDGSRQSTRINMISSSQAANSMC